MLVSMNAKLDTLLNLKETVDAMEQSLQHMSAKYDAVLKQMDEHDGEIKNLKKRVTHLEKSEPTAEIDRLKQKVHDLEWRSRRQNLEIHGIPVSEQENLLDKINDLAEQLEVPDLTADQIMAMHRLPSRPDKTPGILVRFSNQATRDLWLEKRVNLKRVRSKAYILENLTNQDKTLIWETREWAKARRYQYVWYKHGKVLVREKDGSQAHVVKTVDDCKHLCRFSLLVVVFFFLLLL
uniref:Putative crack-1 is transposable element n=1 Tax=Ixodes ricinus TaxID=34613 RepID=A0A6B0V3R5_IXORI